MERGIRRRKWDNKGGVREVRSKGGERRGRVTQGFFSRLK